MYVIQGYAGRSDLIIYTPLQMVFVGPASREDAGFDHSYDVLVDTYQAAEDLSDPETYNMGGRMAHHMLYTALQEYPCYDGYLWAPFDTLLNVPRLQLFDQSKFWYHSPFGRYVPNRALDPSAIGNASFHAPPANISPDPANVTTPWKGWGEDWWYVKKQAFHLPPASSFSTLRHCFFFIFPKYVTYRWGYVHKFLGLGCSNPSFLIFLIHFFLFPLITGRGLFTSP